MNREVHVRICGGGRVRFPPATRQALARDQAASVMRFGQIENFDACGAPSLRDMSDLPTTGDLAGSGL
jgi:hypothetical protein